VTPSLKQHQEVFEEVVAVQLKPKPHQEAFEEVVAVKLSQKPKLHQEVFEEAVDVQQRLSPILPVRVTAAKLKPKLRLEDSEEAIVARRVMPSAMSTTAL
jgi:hypothetical protein